MPDHPEQPSPGLSRRELLSTLGKAAALTIVLPPLLQRGLTAQEAAGIGMLPAPGSPAGTASPPLVVDAGPDRVLVMGEATPGRTYLDGWAGYNPPPWRREPWKPALPAVSGPSPTVRWSKASGPGDVAFADAGALLTTATFTVPGEYVLELTADNGESRQSSSFHVAIEAPPPAVGLEPIAIRPYRMAGPVWGATEKALITTWIPQCVSQLERTDLKRGAGGLDNFVEAAKALRGEAHGPHKGYVFSNAFVHNTVESMCVALMVDPQGDAGIEAAQAGMHAALERWIPLILAAQEPDGYLQTAYTLRDRSKWHERWTAEGRGNHEGYTAGYFIEAAIAHHTLTKGADRRLYDAARKLADCWDAHIGPSPKQEWWDDHEAMEMALIHLGRHADEVEGHGAGERYFRLAKFLLDCRGTKRDGFDYDQAHAPVVEQYEAVGHAVRAGYLYAAMTDVALRTRDPDYLSAVRSLYRSIVDRKYYVTGGIGSGETSEGFGPEYSLPNDGYCESCSSCAEIFFQARMNRLYHDARHADLLEETLYNALLGSLDLQGRHYYYDNPPDANVPRYIWHDCPCCVGNIPRTLLSLPTWSYLRGKDDLYVNLFAGGTTTVADVAGTTVQLVQETGYPWKGQVRIRLSPEKPARFALRIRSPNRGASRLYRATPAADGIARVAVNGRVLRPPVERGYAVIARRWQAGDTVDLLLPMRVQRVHADPRVKQLAGRVALKYGPLLYNIERTEQDIALPLDRRAALTAEWRPDFLGGVTVIKGHFANGAPLLAIPNFTRYNREAGTEYPREPEKPADGSPPKPFRPTSLVWIKEV